MDWLVLGATGALGRTLMETLHLRRIPAMGAARAAADYAVDVTDLGDVQRLLRDVDPQVVVNCAALVDLAACDADPAGAYAVNARPVATLAAWCARHDRKLVQISTDQFFHGGADPRARHGEDAPVRLTHEYARSKYAGEAFAQTAPGALVLRTNMAAVRPGRGKTSIAAWALDAIEQRKPLTLFTDYFCSTIDAPSLCDALVELVEADARGLINVAASEVSSKAEFITALARECGVALNWATRGSARAVLGPDRAIHTGLDVRRAEAVLGRPLPDLAQTARNFVQQRRRAHALEHAF